MGFCEGNQLSSSNVEIIKNHDDLNCYLNHYGLIKDFSEFIFLLNAHYPVNKKTDAINLAQQIGNFMISLWMVHKNTLSIQSLKSSWDIILELYQQLQINNRVVVNAWFRLSPKVSSLIMKLQC
tara:strand:+ start:1941 stop:2312 length:372 start_codon:yes stop_codon:yes gene_type:complete